MLRSPAGWRRRWRDGQGASMTFPRSRRDRDVGGGTASHVPRGARHAPARARAGRRMHAAFMQTCRNEASARRVVVRFGPEHPQYALDRNEDEETLGLDRDTVAREEPAARVYPAALDPILPALEAQRHL